MVPESARGSRPAAILRFAPAPRPAPAPPPEPLADFERLFPEAYRSTLAGGARRLLPGVRRWLFALVAVVALLLLLSIPAWRAATAGLRAAVERSLSQPSATAAAGGEPAGAP